MTGRDGRVAPELERTIARILSVGTALSVGLLTIGVALMIAGAISPLSGGPAFDLGRLPADLVALRPEGVLWLGLLAIVATPVGRVTAGLVGYLDRRERGMAVVSAAILAVIAASVGLAVAPGG